MAVALGIDVGQARDPTAIAVVELAAPVYSLSGQKQPATLHITHLERMRLNTPYPAIRARIEELALKLWFLDPEICIDATGVGKPVVDELRASKKLERIHGITVTGGTAENLQRREGSHESWTCGKGVLIHSLASLVYSGRLHASAELADFDQLAKELQDISHVVTGAGRERFEVDSDGSHHADILFAVALAAWRLQRPRPVAGSFRLDMLSR